MTKFLSWLDEALALTLPNDKACSPKALKEGEWEFVGDLPDDLKRLQTLIFKIREDHDREVEQGKMVEAHHDPQAEGGCPVCKMVLEKRVKLEGLVRRFDALNVIFWECFYDEFPHLVGRLIQLGSDWKYGVAKMEQRDPVMDMLAGQLGTLIRVRA